MAGALKPAPEPDGLSSLGGALCGLSGAVAPQVVKRSRSELTPASPVTHLPIG